MVGVPDFSADHPGRAVRGGFGEQVAHLLGQERPRLLQPRPGRQPAQQLAAVLVVEPAGGRERDPEQLLVAGVTLPPRPVARPLHEVMRLPVGEVDVALGHRPDHAQHPLVVVVAAFRPQPEFHVGVSPVGPPVDAGFGIGSLLGELVEPLVDGAHLRAQVVPFAR